MKPVIQEPIPVSPSGVRKGVYPVIDPKSNLKELETLAFATSKMEGHLKKSR